jgi:uncharacterized protein YbjT (DUF2867 family)
MAPSLLVIGATGNTGRSLVETLSSLLPSSRTLSGHRIIALTRSSTSPAAQALAKLRSVEVVEQNWVQITSSWLRDHGVTRAFIAPHTQPNAFSEESQFYVEALEAGVEYVVRVSTTAGEVYPSVKAYYARTHWAIEAMLGTPEFEKLRWTSLQPNSFAAMYFATAVQFVQKVRETGRQEGPLRLVASEDAPVAVIDAGEVGVVAAHFLVQEDTGVHNRQKYVLNGPEDITGRQIVEMVEREIGAKVESVAFKDTSFVDHWAAAVPEETRHLIRTIKYAPEATWKGICTADSTSKEVLELAAPKRRPAELFKEMLEA